MKHSSFCRGMAKLQAKGVSKQQAFNRMKNLSRYNNTKSGSILYYDKRTGEPVYKPTKAEEEAISEYNKNPYG